MSRKRSSFLKRAILLSIAAVLLCFILVLATFPYERVIDRALVEIGARTRSSISVGERTFWFPNRVTLYGLQVVPKERPFDLLRMEFRKLSVEVGLKALVAGRLRTKSSGILESGDSDEGDYELDGIVSVRKQGSEVTARSRQPWIVDLENVRITGSGVNFEVDGHVIVTADRLNPVLNLAFTVQTLDRVDSANYALHNLLRFVKGCVPEEDELPVTFSVHGAFSQLTVRHEEKDAAA